MQPSFAIILLVALLSGLGGCELPEDSSDFQPKTSKFQPQNRFLSLRTNDSLEWEFKHWSAYVSSIYPYQHLMDSGSVKLVIDSLTENDTRLWFRIFKQTHRKTYKGAGGSESSVADFIPVDDTVLFHAYYGHAQFANGGLSETYNPSDNTLRFFSVTSDLLQSSWRQDSVITIDGDPVRYFDLFWEVYLEKYQVVAYKWNQDDHGTPFDNHRLRLRKINDKEVKVDKSMSIGFNAVEW